MGVVYKICMMPFALLKQGYVGVL